MQSIDQGADVEDLVMTAIVQVANGKPKHRSRCSRRCAAVPDVARAKRSRKQVFSHRAQDDKGVDKEEK